MVTRLRTVLPLSTGRWWGTILRNCSGYNKPSSTPTDHVYEQYNGVKFDKSFHVLRGDENEKKVLIGSEIPERKLVNEKHCDLTTSHNEVNKSDINNNEDSYLQTVSMNNQIQKYVEPFIFKETYSNLAPLIKYSETLQKLLLLGVNISTFNYHLDVVEKLIKADFNSEVLPYLKFLEHYGRPGTRFSKYLNNKAYIFNSSLSQWQEVVDYLQHIGFSLPDIQEIVTFYNQILLDDVKNIDRNLKYLSKTLKLSGKHLKLAVVKTPFLLRATPAKLNECLADLTIHLGLSDYEMKKLIINNRKTMSRKFFADIISNFKYLMEIMKVDKYLILEHADVLSHQKQSLREKHRFLLMLGRAQYNPSKEQYVSLNDMYQLTDEEFCEKIAKTTMTEFQRFLKCI